MAGFSEMQLESSNYPVYKHKDQEIIKTKLSVGDV